MHDMMLCGMLKLNQLGSVCIIYRGMGVHCLYKYFECYGVLKQQHQQQHFAQLFNRLE